MPEPQVAARRPGDAITALGPRYRRLVASAAAANLGDGLMMIALMWLASSISRDPAVIALIGLASRLPWLILSLPAGVIVDRVDRRRLVVQMDLLRCVCVAALGVVVLLASGDLPTPEELDAGAAAPTNAGLLIAAVTLAALVLGCAEVLRDNAAQTLLPSLVEHRQLERANARLWGAEISANQFIGPPLGGVLVGLAVAIPFLLNAGLLALSAVLLIGMSGTYRARAPEAPVGGVATATATSWRADLSEGISWLWRHRLLRTLALMLGVMNLLGAAAFTTLVLFVQEALGLLDGWAFGLVITGSAIGAVLGSLVGDRIARRLDIGPTLLLAVTGMGTGMAVAGLTSWPVLFWCIEVGTGLMVVLWNVVTVSLRQRIIPDHLLGRVNAAYRFFGWGMMALGAPLGATLIWLVEPHLGREMALRSPYLLAAAGYLALAPLVLIRLRTSTVRASEESVGQPPPTPPTRADLDQRDHG